MRDPYAVLGVTKAASADDLKSAFRKLAKKYHPDINPGDAEVERRFKEANSAYDLLSDKTKRARFDRGEIDADGKEKARPFPGGFSSNPGGARRSGGGGFESEYARAGGGRGFNADDLFSDLFETFGGRRGKTAQKGGDIRITLTLSFMEAARGCSKRVRLPTNREVDVRVPAGSETGQALRLANLGKAGADGGSPGDAIVELKVAPHPHFRREGRDIWLDLPISLKEAVLGARVPTPTIDGNVNLTVPKGADSGTVLRLKGKGVARKGDAADRGDQFVKLIVKLPAKSDSAFIDAIKRLPDDAEDPRRKAGLT
jgi:DnaJ-class molecular chaperone